MTANLQLKLEPPIARIILDRPERRNAMSAAMWNALRECCATLETAANIQAVIVEGVGGHFCAGADIMEFDDVFSTRDRAREYLAGIEHALEALARLDRPTIGKLEGSCVGGGLAIALACDMRVAGEKTVLSVPPAKLGLLYGVVETRLLVETIGVAAAKELLFSGRRIHASDALTLRLVNRVTLDAELASVVESEARLWAGLSSASIRGAKKAVRAVLDGWETQLRRLVEDTAMGADFIEGRTAFREKREPDFIRKN